MTGSVFESMGIHTIAELRQLSPEVLHQHFGEHGDHSWRLAHGLDDRRAARQRKEEPKAAMQAPFRLPEQHVPRATRKARRRLITPRPSAGPAMPLLTAYSLIARPLQ